MEQIFGELIAFAFVGFIICSVVILIKKITGVDISNQEEIDDAKEKFKNKIASTKTAETIANCIIKDLRNRPEFDQNNYFNNLPEDDK